MREELLRRLLAGWAPFVLYPLLALLSFPTLGHLLFRRRAIAYELDTFELPRTGTGDDWLSHGIQLWNTHLTSGNALFAQQSNTPFGLDVVLEPLLGAFGAYLVFVWLLAAIAGIGMHLFLRDSMDLGPAATIVGAIVYMFGFWHYIYGLAGPAIPLLLWIFDRALEPGPRRWRYLAGTIASVAFVLYNGLSQVVLLVAAVQLAWVIITAPHSRQVPTRVWMWLVVWGLGIALYAPLVTTQLVMLPISVRAHWDLQALFHPSLLAGLGTIAAHFSPILAAVPFGGELGASPGRYGTYFVGALGMTLVVLALVAGRRDRRTWFLVALLALIPLFNVMAFATGSLQAHLGFLRSFQLDRIRHVVPFLLAALVALGFQAVAGSLGAGQSLRIGRWGRAALGISVVPAVIALLAAGLRVAADVPALWAREHEAIGWALLLLALGIGLMALAASMWIVVRGHPGRIRAAGRALMVVVILVFLGERATYAWGERLADVHQTYLGSWQKVLGMTEAKRFLLRQPGIDVDRVLTFGGRPNQVAAAGMLQVDGYQSLYPETYHRFFGALISPALVDDEFRTTYYWKWGNRAVTFGPEVDPELVALSGARWLLVLDGSRPTVPGIVERFRGSSGVVYEVISVLPRTFVADRLTTVPDQDGMLQALIDADLSTLRTTVIMGDGPEAEAVRAHIQTGAGTRAQPPGSATFVSYQPDRVVIAVHATQPGVLVLTDVMAPGWVATRDGVSVPIRTVDETFRGVPVDATTKEVVFRYEPVFTYVGFVIAGVGALVTLVLIAVFRRRDARPAGENGARMHPRS